jgi:hypothetical protein
MPRPATAAAPRSIPTTPLRSGTTIPKARRRLVPFAKAYSGLTDAEIGKVDAAIRKTTWKNSVRCAAWRPSMVFEIGFEGIARSPAQGRHRRALSAHLRIRDDKSIEEADTLDVLKTAGRAMNCRPPLRLAPRSTALQRCGRSMPGSPNAAGSPFLFSARCERRRRRPFRPAACEYRGRQDLCRVVGRYAARQRPGRVRAPASRCCGSRRCAPWRPTPCALAGFCRRARSAMPHGSAARTGDTGSAERARQSKPSIGAGHHAGKPDATAEQAGSGDAVCASWTWSSSMNGMS